MSSGKSASTRSGRALFIVITLLVGLPAAALLYPGAVGARSRPDDAMQELAIRAADYSFQMPTTLRPGLTRVRLDNAGTELHHVWMIRLEQGKGLADVMAALKPGTGFPAWAKNIGGPNSPVPGGESVAILNLAPGHYAVICVIPGSDGVPHLMKGMAREFDVRGEPLRAAAPAIDVEATLVDYDFIFSHPITPGRHTIRFTNRAAQPHEAFMGRLAPGKKAGDLLAWLGHPEGPPPVIPVGGITGIEAGGSITIEADFESGTYALYCFVPDATDGKEHVAHGMIKEFVVAAP
jgi:hypothetical protein